MRQYQAIWNKIKSQGSDSETLVQVHADAAKRVIQAVRKEKSMENAIRSQLGELSDGKLLAAVVPDKRRAGFVIIHFKLTWSYRDI